MKRYDPARPDNMTGGSPVPRSMQKPNVPHRHPLNDPKTARDGFDNTGTQGYDSLRDKMYGNPPEHGE